MAGSAAALLDSPLLDAEFSAADAFELQPARPAALIAPLSGAFDLAESQSPGHAVRVAHIALTICSRLGVSAGARRTVLYGSLLHDSGVAVVELLPAAGVDGGHCSVGAWVAGRFGLDAEIQDAIRGSHERWDGDGRPRGTSGEAISVEARIINGAHWANEIAEHPENPLRARASLQRLNPREVAGLAGPDVAEAVAAVVRDDDTWTTMWDEHLPMMIAGQANGEGRATVKNVERIAVAMGEMIDASLREPGRSARVAELATQLARRMGMPQSERRAIDVAARLLDVGQMGVPRHVTEKPAILSLEEMELMRHHPGLGARIIERVPGMREVAGWVHAHHERIDGRGYPELLEGCEIPLASRVLAVADSYWALRADRPQREAFSDAEAREILEAGAGERYDGDVVMLLDRSLTEQAAG